LTLLCLPGVALNTSTPVALDEMEQKSNVRHCGRSLRQTQTTGMRTNRTSSSRRQINPNGPDLPLADGFGAASQLHQTGRSCIAQHNKERDQTSGACLFPCRRYAG